MNAITTAEGIYVKKTKSILGTGGTMRETVVESLWYPCNVSGEYIELYPVMDNMKGVMMLKERVSTEDFEREYSLMDNSREIYLDIKNRLG